MAAISDASPLTVWVGSLRYVFEPGRDVVVGHGGHCDIRLDRPGLIRPDLAPRPVPDVLLRFAGGHWFAVDQSKHGLYVDGGQMSTVTIHDGQTIAIGDPEHGPRLTFQIAAAEAPTPATDPMRVPVRPSPPGGAVDRDPTTGPLPVAVPVPAEPETARMQIEPETGRMQVEPETRRLPAAAPEPSPLKRPTNPFRNPIRPFRNPTRNLSEPPVVPPTPASTDAREKDRGLVERVSDATRKLLPSRGDTSPGESPPQTSRLPLQPGARTIGVAAYQLGLTVDGREVFSNVSFTSRPGSLIAVIGPSTARNFALTGVLAGTRSMTSGVLTVDGHDVHAEPEATRFRIGVVSRDNRVHPRLTVQRALEYAAELRLPPNTSPENRDRIVRQVLDELELTPHAKTRVAKLAPTERRCTSMAIELITRPSLLVVDEPAAGLAPEQEKRVIALLRRQADLGCVVVVGTRSLTHLNMCDQVLLLTPAGRLAFAGPPSHIDSALGTTDWYEIFARINSDPEGAHHAFLARQQTSVSPTPPSVARPELPPAGPTFGEQFRLVARRQTRLLLTNPAYSLFLLLFPVALGALTLLIPGQSGLGRPGPGTTNTHEAIEILAALNFAAVVCGTVLTLRDLVSERRIFRREQAVGLSVSAYLLAKFGVFGMIAAAQAAILTTIVVVGKGGPQHGAVLLSNADLELYVSVAATAIVSAIVGLALSSLGNSLREVLPLAVPAVLASLLFAGGLVSLAGTWGYDQVSWFVPAQWGFAAAAATVDLRRTDSLAQQNAAWTHYAGWWVFDMMLLVILGAMWAGLVRYRLRPRRR